LGVCASSSNVAWDVEKLIGIPSSTAGLRVVLEDAALRSPSGAATPRAPDMSHRLRAERRV